MSDLMALNPLDGRYNRHMEPMRQAFSEYALIRYRLKVEVEWLKMLCQTEQIAELAPLSPSDEEFLNGLVLNFDETEARAVKEIEQRTNHDVKAVEYYLVNRMLNSSLSSRIPFIHFGCTSEDINNLAHALMLQAGRYELGEVLQAVICRIRELATDYAALPMLARTHGQTASPTTLGKEMAVFAARLEGQAEAIRAVELKGKMSGAVGNYNAHLAAYPEVDWPVLAGEFISGLGLAQNVLTTQIEPHDDMARLFEALRLWNTILLDLDRDIWTYISLGYFKQQVVAGEVGSSTMPHKVNPIDFENSEGNLGLSSALFSHLAEKLPVSRLQRDLSDSTAIRSMGTAFGYAYLACKSTLRGLNKLTANEGRIGEDLNRAWEVLAEPIQTVMRKAGIENAYDQLKELTRGKTMTQQSVRDFIQSLEIPDSDKQRLLDMTPATYTGLAEKLARQGLAE